MRVPEGYRKRVKHYHTPGDYHELTFSCYQQRPLLTNDTWRGMLAEAIDRAIANHQFRLHAFVFMPEHIHHNPVKRGLCQSIGEWKWSSARFFLSDGRDIDEALPTITKLPVELFDPREES